MNHFNKTLYLNTFNYKKNILNLCFESLVKKNTTWKLK